METSTKKKESLYKRALFQIKKNWQLYLMLLPTLIYFIIFHYVPMYGLQIAFKRFIAADGIWGSEWVGFDHFIRFFQSYSFWALIKNTLLLSFYQLVIVFPIPIIFALMINQVTRDKFKRFVQTVTYAPHFISVVVLVGMIFLFLSPESGVINNLIRAFGGEPIQFMGSTKWFRPVFIISEIWQNTGWSAIIYLAALTAVDPQLHEAAIMDGASKLRRVIHIDIPTIMPIIMILLILEIGSFAAVGYQKVLLMQTPLNIDASEVIQTYVYKTGLLSGEFSYSTAIGLFQNIVNFILLLSMNQLAKKLNQQSFF